MHVIHVRSTYVCMQGCGLGVVGVGWYHAGGWLGAFVFMLCRAMLTEYDYGVLDCCSGDRRQ